MSLNQSRSERNESQFRKTGGGGRSGNSSGGQQRSFTGGRGRGGGGGGAGLNTTAPPLNTNRSFKKSNNAQGGQSRGNGPVNTLDPNTASGVRSVENGGHVSSTLHGASGVPSTPAPAAIPKPGDAPAQKSGRPLPRAPSSQSSSTTSETVLPSTPAKGDGAKGFSLQFGSISPGFMNGMQIPARTSSAPPNLDEQKRDQARGDDSRALPAIPLPSAIPEQNLPKKELASAEQPVTQETPTESKAKRDVQLSPPTQAQKPSVLPTVGISMPLSFHQPTVSMQYGGPNPQIQSQGMPSSSLQLPIQMPLPMGNSSQVPQQVFVPGLQHHLMQTQGVMHQNQNLGFNPQLGSQIPHQLGVNMSTQFSPQQAGKFGTTRKTVKITHPETHEELRLDSRDDGSSGPRSHHGGPPQSQPLPAYTPTNPVSYYTNSYTAATPYFPAQSSLPLTKTQLPASSQAPRFNYAVGQAVPPAMSFVNQSASNTLSAGKSGTSVHRTPDSSNVRDVKITVPPTQSTSTHVTVKASGDPVGEKVIDSNAVEKLEPRKLLNPAVEPGVVGKDFEPASVPTLVDAVKRETVTMSTSLGDVEKKPAKKGHSEPSHQVDVDTDASVLQDSGNSVRVVDSEFAKAKITRTSSGLREGASEAVKVAAQNDVPDVDLGAESPSHSSNSPETQDVVDKAAEDQHARPNDLSLQEEITRQSVVCEQRQEEVLGPGGLQLNDSLKPMEAVKNTDEDGEVEEVVEVADVIAEASQREAEPVASSSEGGDVTKSSASDNEAIPESENPSEANLLHEREVMENTRPRSSSGSNKSSMEANKTKNNRGKKKLKELLQKADSLGTSSDLYMAYKGPEEKKDSVVATEVNCESDLKEDSKPEESSTRKSKDEQSKTELDDWEDAADLSTPKLESQGSLHDEQGVAAKKYTRDFLLTISEQCVDLPEGFEITSDIADALMSVNVNASRGDREYPSPGRIRDRQAGVARLDRHGNGTMDADSWSKQSGPHPLGRDPGIDLAYGSNMMGFRGGPGPNYGVLRNPRAQGHVQHAGGILSGPMHSMGFQGVQRNNSDADRWQRASSFNKGLMPAPQTPLQVMHKAEKKYEVGKISDEEEAKQRRLKGILNKLTPQNFEKLFEQVKEVNIDNVMTLTGVISQIFDKALMEPTFCEMYANFCSHLASELPDLSVDNEKITFKRLLLNKCQEEFERGEREEQEANETDGEGETKQSEEQREEKRLKARRRMLGNIRLIGELYKKRMLTERIMHECIKKLLGQYQNPDEENIEALCKLMSTIGEMIDHPKAKQHMDAYFDLMRQLSNNMALSSRLRFMLKDAIDLRKNKWQQRRKVEGPKKIEEVHRDAVQERQGQAGRLSRGPSMNSAMRRGQPLDFGPRGSMLPSPVGQGGGFRGMPSQVRGYGAQDLRMDERNIYESRTLSVRPSNDESITLGPQGGLARGMAFRGQPSVSSSPLLDTYSSYGDPRRMVGGLNGYTSASERGAYTSREDHFARNASERFGDPSIYGQSSSQELTAGYPNRDFRHPDINLDRSRPTTPPVTRTGASPAQNIPSEKTWPEEHLRSKSILAIKEYYSAKDEKEIVVCIKELNAPSFYPTVVSLWVTDSFERKDMERDLLAKLLVNLTKPGEGMFFPAQLIEGFEDVLSNLEDTVNDAPKAPEFLGRIFGKVISENVVSLKEVGRLIHEGGEKPGRLVDVGLAADVLGSVLEMIRSEKGESTLNAIRANSNLQLADFRPPDPIKSRKLEMFM